MTKAKAVAAKPAAKPADKQEAAAPDTSTTAAKDATTATEVQTKTPPPQTETAKDQAEDTAANTASAKDDGAPSNDELGAVIFDTSANDAVLKAEYDSGYQDGFSAGFIEANNGTAPIISGAGALESNTISVACIALSVSGAHRKGGIGALIERIGQFFGSIPDEHRSDALAMAKAIAAVRPQDIANGNYERHVVEALAYLTGEQASHDEDAGSAAAAFSRMQAAFGEDNAPPQAAVENENPVGDLEGMNTDPRAPDAAADRLGRAI